MTRELGYTRNLEPPAFDGPAAVIWVNVHHAVGLQYLLEDSGCKSEERFVEQFLEVVKLDNHDSELC